MYLLDIPFEEKLQSNLQAAEANRVRITRRGDLTIGDKPAVRIWTEGGGFDFPNTISSYINYSNSKTILIASHYRPGNSDAVETI